MPKLVLICGAPGSGKSTLAKTYKGFYHVEADFWHIDDNGKYSWDPRNLRMAHLFCQKAFLCAIYSGLDVVVSNTFIKNKDRVFYINQAESHGYAIEIVILKNNYGNVHGVPEEKVAEMDNSFQPIPIEWQKYLI